MKQNKPKTPTNLEMTWIPIDQVVANPRNARTHSKKQVRALADCIRQFGFTNPLILDGDHQILAGHGRLAAAKLLGMEKVPTILVDHLSEPQKRAYVLADNKLAERAGWDRNALALELGELSVLLPEIDLSVDLTGFEVGEVDVILSDHEEQRLAKTDDDVGEVAEIAVTRPGDLWILGRHRVLCGDARDRDAFVLLLEDERADLIFTDPPFNVPIAGHAMGRGAIKHADFAMAAGEMSDAEFRAFLTSILGNAARVSRDGSLHFVFVDWRHVSDLVEVGRSIYTEMKNLVVWAKSNGGQGSFYRSAHELIGVFKSGTGEHVNNVELGRFGRNRTNVWAYAGVNTFKSGRLEELASHPTVKPVALVADAIKDVTNRNDIVLDAFGGSGTTLIAAERTGRRARLIEIEPRYVDVTIRRFEAVTKADAIHAGTGNTFADEAELRRAGTCG